MDKQNVVQYHQMMLPTVKALQLLGGSANIDELNSKVIDIMQLPDDMCNVLHKDNNTLTEVEYRLAWSRTYLKKYGIIDNSSRGVWSFNEKFNGSIDKLSADKIVQKVRSLTKTNKSTDENDDDLENDGVDLPDEVMN